MVENGVITVTCEFCNATYVFEPAEVSGTAAVDMQGDCAWSETPLARRGLACSPQADGSIDRALLLRGVEREGRDLDVELLAGGASPCRRCRP